MTKFDDLSWHAGAADFPDDAPEENGATHIGMFLAWAIDNGLFADPEVPPEAVEAVRKRTMPGRQFLIEHCDGKLFSGLFSEESADFAASRYDNFMADFKRLLCAGLASDYYVEDTEANQAIMAKALDLHWAQCQRERNSA